MTELTAGYSTEIQMICLKCVNTVGVGVPVIRPHGLKWLLHAVGFLPADAHLFISFSCFQYSVHLGICVVQLGNELPSMAHVSYVKYIHLKRREETNL